MGKKIYSDMVCAIDIGTTKICVLIAIKDMDGKLELIGIGQSPSYGLKKGVIVNISKTVESIKKAIKQAQDMAGVKIERAAVGISGGHINSFNSTGVVAIKNRDVSQEDIDRVVDAAKAVALPEDQEILHILPQYFKVDSQDLILDSLGMHGVRLEAQIHIITGAVSSAQNIIKSCELSGLNVSDIVLEQIASADAVLSETEKELGVGILDIGGGTCDFAIYKDGRIMHSKVIPLAGNHFTNDLAVSLGISLAKAEEIKRKYGLVYVSKEHAWDLDKTLTIEPDFGQDKKDVLLKEIYEVLRFRAEEIFDILDQEISQYRLKNFMPAGLVLTGGGSLLVGMIALAKEKFNMSVRLGLPRDIPDIIKSPIYSTGYGLLLYANGQGGAELMQSSQEKSAFTKVFKRMKSWIYDFL